MDQSSTNGRKNNGLLFLNIKWSFFCSNKVNKLCIFFKFIYKINLNNKCDNNSII